MFFRIDQFDLQNTHTLHNIANLKINFLATHFSDIFDEYFEKLCQFSSQMYSLAGITILQNARFSIFFLAFN